MPKIPPIKLPAARWTMHEFFAGSGWVAYGLRGMFKPVWANDISPQKAAVYRANFGGGRFHLGDIQEIQGDALPPAHLSWASFPCQDLSLAGAMGGIHAARSGLVWEWLRVLDETAQKPKLLMVENVSGLLSAAKGDNYRALHHALAERGYRCGAVLLNASCFVPQSRPRVFVIAVDQAVPLPPSLVGEGPCWLHNKAAAQLGADLPGWIWWRTEKPPRRRQDLRDIVQPQAPFGKDHVLPLIPPAHQARLAELEEAWATGYRRTRRGAVQLELRFDGIAGCLRTPEGGSSKQYLVVKQKGETHARLLTVRETARLMGAPDNFVLPGSDNDGYKAMGDAVAAPAARFLGQRFLVPLVEAAYGD